MCLLGTCVLNVGNGVLGSGCADSIEPGLRNGGRGIVVAGRCLPPARFPWPIARLANAMGVASEAELDEGMAISLPVSPVGDRLPNRPAAAAPRSPISDSGLLRMWDRAVESAQLPEGGPFTMVAGATAGGRIALPGALALASAADLPDFVLGGSGAVPQLNRSNRPSTSGGCAGCAPAR